MTQLCFSEGKGASHCQQSYCYGKGENEGEKDSDLCQLMDIIILLAIWCYFLYACKKSVFASNFTFTYFRQKSSQHHPWVVILVFSLPCFAGFRFQTLSAFCLTASEDHLYVGCADGVLRVFDAATLHFVTTFPKPHFLGVNVSDGIDPRWVTMM